MRRFRKRLPAWFAILALLLGALAPVASRAMAEQNGQLLIDVCSAGGAHRLAIPASDAGLYLDAALAEGEGSDDSSLLDSLSSCPYCTSAATGVGLPPPERSLPFAATGVSERLPLPYLVAPRPFSPWSPAHPRAPPASV